MTLPAKKEKKDLDPKAKVCKESNCAEVAQVGGFCRLHFLRIVKAKGTEKGTEVTAGAKNEAKKGRDRRRGNRMIGLDALGSPDEAPPHQEEAIENMGRLTTDLTAFLEMDELPPGGATEELKKTGNDD